MTVATPQSGKLTPELEQAMSASGPGERHLCWVFFGDKDLAGYPAFDARAMERRSRVRRSLSYGDLSVPGRYLESLKGTGAGFRTASRWLNAASVEADRAQIDRLAALPEVERLDLVAVFRTPDDLRGARPLGAKELPALDYGYADEQIKLMRVNELHARGYTGSGVRLCIIDTGFDRDHESLRRVQVLAERDFQRMIYDTVSVAPLHVDTLPDTVTAYQAEQDGPASRIQTQHGTAMLSIIGGYKTGVLIGSAYNADFILAKTEYMRAYGEPDFYQEEDWWVAALEWADSLGADIVSSSLGYKFWTNLASYRYRDMNGRTTKSAIAADSAASRGMLVVNAIGNTSSNARPDTSILTPGDAEGVLTMGGVWASTKQWASPQIGSGACAGPTSDSTKVPRPGAGDSVWIRRIKPDVSSCWQNAFADNNPDSLNLIKSSVGTSGATALTAGLCALLLQAHPSWGPQDIIRALKYSGSNRATVEAYLAHPDSIGTAQSEFDSIALGHRYFIAGGSMYDFYDVYRIGWGIPDGMAALNYTTPEVVLPDEDELFDPYPNPAKPGDPGIYFPYFLTRDSYNVTITIYSLDGRLVRKLDLGQQLAGEYPGIIDFARNRQGAKRPAFWDLKDSQGKSAPGGLYLILLTTGWGQSTKKIALLR